MQRGIRVFVYGTLKGMDKGVFVGKAVTKKRYLLFDGNFPVMSNRGPVSDIKRGFVSGEVYDVSLDEFKGLDAYEGYPELYTRDQIPVTMHTLRSGVQVTEFTTAWAYFGNKVNLNNRAIIIPGSHGLTSWG